MSFDPSSNQCREKSTVNCIGRDGRQNEICQGQKNGQRFFNPLNCAEYFECQNNQRISQTCPTGQFYNHQLTVCNPRANVNCGSRSIPEDLNIRQEGIQSPCDRPGIYIKPHPLPCHSTYFICIDGNMMQHACAQGIIFNPDTLQCDFAANAGCDARRTPQIPRTFNCSSGQKFSPHVTNCNQYLICVNETLSPQLMTCPTGQIWNNNRARCENPTLSSPCNGRISTT